MCFRPPPLIGSLVSSSWCVLCSGWQWCWICRGKYTETHYDVSDLVAMVSRCDDDGIPVALIKWNSPHTSP